MKQLGIKLVRLAVKADKIVTLDALLTKLEQGMSVKEAVKDYRIGEFECTEGQSLVNDGWVEVFVSLSAYCLFKDYQYLEKITQNNEI